MLLVVVHHFVNDITVGAIATDGDNARVPFAECPNKAIVNIFYELCHDDSEIFAEDFTKHGLNIAPCFARTPATRMRINDKKCFDHQNAFKNVLNRNRGTPCTSATWYRQMSIFASYGMYNPL